MKKTTKILATLSLVMAVLLLIAQGGYLFFARHYGIHYIYDGMFFAVNCLILLLAFLGFAPYAKNKRPLIVLAGFLLIFQGGALFLGMRHQVVVSSSPHKSNTFMLRKDKRTGFAAYQRNLYYQWPQLQALLPAPAQENAYLLFSNDVQQLTYPIGSQYKIDWPNENLAVFSYQTTDGSTAQFIRSYEAETAAPSPSGLAPAIIGEWQSPDGKIRLQAQGNPYALLVDGQKTLLNPEYQISFSQSACVYTDAQGNALYALIMDSSENRLTVIPADPTQQNEIYHLTRTTNPL